MPPHPANRLFSSSNNPLQQPAVSHAPRVTSPIPSACAPPKPLFPSFFSPSSTGSSPTCPRQASTNSPTFFWRKIPTPPNRPQQQPNCRQPTKSYSMVPNSPAATSATSTHSSASAAAPSLSTASFPPGSFPSSPPARRLSTRHAMRDGLRKNLPNSKVSLTASTLQMWGSTWSRMAFSSVPTLVAWTISTTTSFKKADATDNSTTSPSSTASLRANTARFQAQSRESPCLPFAST